jgi:cytochrome c556
MMSACNPARLAGAILLVLLEAACAAGDHMDHLPADHALHASHMQPAPDARQAVRFPPMLYDHTLANMRDHLSTLQAIQAALAKADYDAASHLAEERLGLTSLPAHGAHEVAPYMPQPMQEMGTAMHRAASRFAVEASNASATGDVKPALAALSTVTAQCVACHAAYRLEK